MYVVATGAPRRSARARSSSQAPERRTPPPAQTSGAAAPASKRAASSSRSLPGSGSASGVASSPPDWQRRSPRRAESTGISTNTGPLGGVSARRQASASTTGISSALCARAAHFTTGSKDAFWSGSSCRKPRPAPIRSRGIWLAIATKGTCALAASINAASEMRAPGPVERSRGAGRPLVRAYPSAAKPAESSVRSPTASIELSRSPSQIARAWIPGTPKATSAPSASRLSATRRPPYVL